MTLGCLASAEAYAVISREQKTVSMIFMLFVVSMMGAKAAGSSVLGASKCGDRSLGSHFFA